MGYGSIRPSVIPFKPKCCRLDNIKSRYSLFCMETCRSS
nr:MAG TPA: hypothetical protein [Caudoviricetes sp.]